MEKQPVDDLFARKLREAEAPVGPDVFNQLQQRQGTKPLSTRRPMLGWWSIASAACLGLVMWFLYMSGETEQGVNVPVVSKRNPLKTPAEEKTHALAVGKKDQPRTYARDGAARVNNLSESKMVAATTYPVRKTSSPISKAVTNAQLPTAPKQKTRRIEISQTQENPLTTPNMPINSVPVERTALVSNKSNQATERTIVLTIDEPQPVPSLVAVKNNVPTPDAPSQPNGLTSLFGKIKQLKNGEVLAKATPVGTQNNQKNRFGRVFSEVKESLKNETTLE